MTLNVLAARDLTHVKTIDEPLPAWSDNPLCVFKRAIGTLTLGQSCEMTVAKSKITVTYCDGLNRKREPFDVSVDGGSPLRFAKKSQVVDTVTRQAEFLETAAELADSAAESPAESTKAEWVANLLEVMDEQGIPVFFKGNLEWDPWREEFPHRDLIVTDVGGPLHPVQLELAL